MQWMAKWAGVSALPVVSIALLSYACVESSGSVTYEDGAGGATSSGPGAGPGAGVGAAAGNFDKRALLESLADEVFIQTYDEFVLATDGLVAATNAHAESPTEASLAAARSAWVEAMVVWQRAELLQVGPAGAMSDAAGGEDLRDEIYSWPLVNACRVDQELVEGNYADPQAFANEPINVRGLDALEHLLFNESTSNACAPQNAINAEGQWSPIIDSLPSRRADYARTLAADLRDSAVELRDAWTGGFDSELATAGEGSTVYETSQEALNAVSDALFYLDKVVKDMKVAVPAGLAECDSDTCPDALESKLAGISKAQIRGNLVGFRLAFTGGAPDAEGALGFDDWLIALGAEELATTMTDDIDAAIEAVDAIEEEDLAAALEQDQQSVVDLYFAMKAITDNLKTQFLSLLDLELPKAVQGDND